mgnify:CR=1 FL=1
MMYQTVLIENITTENVTEKMCSSDGNVVGKMCSPADADTCGNSLLIIT